MVVFYTISLCLLAHISVWGPTAEAFILTDRQSRSHVNKSSRFPASVVLMSESDESGQDNQEGEEEPIVQATVKIDDGGSNLTNRFKYKVNALMGVFDPQDGDDDERQEGNILNGEPKNSSLVRLYTLLILKHLSLCSHFGFSCSIHFQHRGKDVRKRCCSGRVCRRNKESCARNFR
jgi:hypothetical protein